MSVKPVDLTGCKILVTGISGQVALPVAKYYSDRAEVWGLARFGDKALRTEIESHGIHTVAADLARPETLCQVADDFDYVLNYAVVKSGDFDYDLAANAEGIGHLIRHCRKARAILHCSSTAVYQYEGHSPRKEESPLGDNHRAMFPTYSMAKIAAESVARYASRVFEVPVIIARLSVPYGSRGGWPLLHFLQMQQDDPITIHPERPNIYNPIHEDDYIEKVPYLLGAAEVNGVTVNFGGSEAVSIESWCAWMGDLTGFLPRWKEDPSTFGALEINTDKMHRLIGPTRVDWREGLRRMLQQHFPEVLNDG